MAQQVPVGRDAIAPESYNAGVHEVAGDLGYERLAIVNVVFLGMPGADDGRWILIDTGMPGSARAIRRSARGRFGEQSRPAAIVLTHGHFDHVGAVEELAREWDVPVLRPRDGIPVSRRASLVSAARSERRGRPHVHGLFPLSAVRSIVEPTCCVPYLQTSRSPRARVEVDRHARSFPGHVSLWNEARRTLIAGDAFVTTAQESVYAVATQRPSSMALPMYFTPDWEHARESVERLARLEPELVVTGHGPAMQGPEMTAALHALARDFDTIAIPHQGRYVNDPARFERSGVTQLPESKR